MAVNSKKIKLMELTETKIYKMTADVATAPTYDATGIVLPGIMKVTIAPKTETKKLLGDSKTLDVYQKTVEIELDVEHAMFSLEAMKVLVGGDITETGTLPNITKVVYALTGDNATPPYFKIMGKWTYAGDGNTNASVTLWKCKVTDPPNFELNDASGNFGTVKFKAIALPCDSNKAWFDITVDSAAIALA